MNLIHGEEVYGVGVDAQTRCAHYHSEVDVIAIKFKCCGKWFPCYECHAESANHSAKVWDSGERQTRAILCGVCGYKMTIAEYLECDSVCPQCRCNFNPKCAYHYDLYFEVSSEI
jgi:uncharacterized CHY-type Zn-finger protein